MLEKNLICLQFSSVFMTVENLGTNCYSIAWKTKRESNKSMKTGKV